ncbi:MAG: pseudouridine synthase [Lentisphaerales bacterium]|nr:pseudouridine synthase [Lentisphaerales bacterium]
MSKNYSTAPMPSFVWIPDGLSCNTILEFLIEKFPRIPRETWVTRIEDGKVYFEDETPVTSITPYIGSRRLKYFREVPHEEPIPFKEKVLFENDNFIIVDKPHFLPIHPAGKFVNETLVSRLKSKHGYEDLAIAHRLDRLTAGLVLATKKKEVRSAYQQLFMERQISKTYLAIGPLPTDKQKSWTIKNHLGPHLEHFRMKVIESEAPNSESKITLLKKHDDIGLFSLKPITGKKHQLRVHMTCIGSKVLNDPLYPECPQHEVKDNFNQPLQLLAYELCFQDPLTKEDFSFQSQLSLAINL